MSTDLQARFLAGMSRLAPAVLTRWVPTTRKFKGQPLILGYYSVTHDPQRTVPFILKHGFQLSYNGLKGWGLRVPNSTASCALAAPNSPVIVCGIEPNPNLIRRHRAEISDSLTDSEYFVTDSRIVYPLFLARFQISVPNDKTVYVHCDICHRYTCDVPGGCYCRQDPVILKDDLVTID